MTAIAGAVMRRADLNGAYNEFWFDRGNQSGADSAYVAGGGSSGRKKSQRLTPRRATGRGGPPWQDSATPAPKGPEDLAPPRPMSGMGR